MTRTIITLLLVPVWVLKVTMSAIRKLPFTISHADTASTVCVINCQHVLYKLPAVLNLTFALTLTHALSEKS